MEKCHSDHSGPGKPTLCQMECKFWAQYWMGMPKARSVNHEPGRETSSESSSMLPIVTFCPHHKRLRENSSANTYIFVEFAPPNPANLEFFSVQPVLLRISSEKSALSLWQGVLRTRAGTGTLKRHCIGKNKPVPAFPDPSWPDCAASPAWEYRSLNETIYRSSRAKINV